MAKARAAGKGAQATKKGAAKAKSDTKKGAKPTKKRAAKRAPAPAALSAVEKQRLLKPLTGFGELIERLASTWKDHGGQVKVPGLTPARLLGLLRKAAQASRREEAVRTAFEAKIQPLADRRLRAEHDAWKAALDLYAMVKTASRTDAGIVTPFEFFADALARRRGGGAPAGAGGEKAEGPG